MEENLQELDIRLEEDEPERGGGVSWLAVLVVALIVTAIMSICYKVAFEPLLPPAWGDSLDRFGRASYSRAEIAGGAFGHKQPVINSSVNSSIGDERHFLGIRRVGNAASYSLVGEKRITAVYGQVYEVSAYIVNDAVGTVAMDVQIGFGLPTESEYSATIRADVQSTNSTPGWCWDTVVLCADKPFRVEYVPGTARLYKVGDPDGEGMVLADSIVAGGVMVGCGLLDGKLSGGDDYALKVTIKVEIKQ